jgi:hypothetical protein
MHLSRVGRSGHRSRQSLIAICGGESAHIVREKHDRNGGMLPRSPRRCDGLLCDRGEHWPSMHRRPAHDLRIMAVQRNAFGRPSARWMKRDTVDNIAGLTPLPLRLFFLNLSSKVHAYLLLLGRASFQDGAALLLLFDAR